MVNNFILHKHGIVIFKNLLNKIRDRQYIYISRACSEKRGTESIVTTGKNIGKKTQGETERNDMTV